MMMKTYVRVALGLVVELIEPFVMTLPASTDDEGNEVPGTEREVPIEERFHPDIVALLTLVPDGKRVAVGDSYDGTTFGPPPPPEPPPLPTATEVRAQRDEMLRMATLRMAPLEDAVELDEASAQEVAALKAWRQFRVALNRIEAQAGFPGAVVWPGVPS